MMETMNDSEKGSGQRSENTLNVTSEQRVRRPLPAQLCSLLAFTQQGSRRYIAQLKAQPSQNLRLSRPRSLLLAPLPVLSSSQTPILRPAPVHSVSDMCPLADDLPGVSSEM
ncbi:hypothetical protein NQZ68_028820 [Dissostichus eleginoides]|nr:hypothetical protein NQZ68_028820 [Dissostichus eleginoides]